MNSYVLFRTFFGICFTSSSIFLFIIQTETNQTFVHQVAGILMMAGLLLLGWRYALHKRISAAIVGLIGIAILAGIPAFGTYMGFVFFITILLLLYWMILRIVGRTTLAAAFGACIFGCSTWLPLAFITGWSSDGMLGVRDALLDPNQISVSHGAGGYIGIPGAVFAVAGVLIYIGMLMRKRFTPSQGETIMAVLFAVSLFVTFSESPLQYSNAIIVVVACIGWFASLAFDRMQRFLGIRDMFVQTLMVILFCISILDLMSITARTFTY